MNYITLIEKEFLKTKNITILKNLKIGNIISIGYNISDENKEKIQYYEGIIISKKNKNLNQTFTLFRNSNGIKIEQIFFLYSPNIISVIVKKQLKIRKAKLYFLKTLKTQKIKFKEKKN